MSQRIYNLQARRNKRHVVVAFVLGITIVVAAIAALASDASRGQSAVAQVNRMFMCVQPDGLVARGPGPEHRPLIRAYGMDCGSQNQQVSFAVDGVPSVTTPSTLKPPVTQPATTGAPITSPPTSPPSGNEIRLPGTYTTGYDYADNNPPGSAQISHPGLHSEAAGTGTYADPITVAVDHLSGGKDQFAPGTRFYVPNLRAYLIAEDTTGETAPGTVHLDVWVDGRTSSVSSAFDCMSHITGHYLVVQNPAPNYAVIAGSLSANNTCRQLFGDTLVTSGGSTPTTAVSGGSSACPTAKPASTYQGATLTVNQTLQYAYNAGFRSVSQLQAVVGIGRAESSLVTQTRNWHPNYGCRPVSDVIGVQGPASAWNATHTQQMNSDRGVWQISSHFWPQYTDAQCDDPAQAAGIVWTLSGHGADFSPWDTWASGAAQSLAPSTATVNAVLAAQ